MPDEPLLIEDVFRVEDALDRIRHELGRRSAGAVADDRFDPILDSLLDLMDALGA